MPMEEGLAAHHHRLGMGAVNVPGGDADGKEVGGARSDSREGAIITRLKITLRDGEALAVDPAGRSGRPGGEGGIVDNNDNDDNDNRCRGGGGAQGQTFPPLPGRPPQLDPVPGHHGSCMHGSRPVTTGSSLLRTPTTTILTRPMN